MDVNKILIFAFQLKLLSIKLQTFEKQILYCQFITQIKNQFNTITIQQGGGAHDKAIATESVQEHVGK